MDITKLQDRIFKKLGKHESLARQFVNYFGVALIGLLVDFGTLVFLREVLGAHYLLAAAGGFIAGLAINYALSNKYVFSNPKIKSQALQFLLFAVIGLVGLSILSLLMWGLTDGLRVNYVLSKVLATVVVYMWNFFARKTLYN